MSDTEERCYKFRPSIGNRSPLPAWNKVLPIHEHVDEAVGHVMDRVESLRNLAYTGATITEPPGDEASSEECAAWSQFQHLEYALDQLVSDLCELQNDTRKMKDRCEDLTVTNKLLLKSAAAMEVQS